MGEEFPLEDHCIKEINMSFIRKMDGFLIEYSDRDCLADREGKRIFTYRQFDELSGKVAGKLQAKGIKQGDAVIICLGRCTEYVAAEYGAMRYGAVAIPIIPSYPAPRVDYIKKDARTNKYIID